MKNLLIRHRLWLLLIFGTVTACTTYKWVAPPYTNVEKLASLKGGMSIDEVNKNLGITPFNIYHLQEDGSSILTYNYRLKDRKASLPGGTEPKKDFMLGESGQTTGELYYQKEAFLAYVLFKDAKLTAIITDEGLKSAEYVMMVNNNLKLLSQKEIRQLNIRKVGDYFILNGKDTVQLVRTLF